MFCPPNKKMTEEDEQLIVDKYREGFTGKKILTLFNGKFKTTKTIYDILRKYGVRTKAGPAAYVKLNHRYFNQIDSPAKAYVLGLVLTDGWVTKKSDNSYQIYFGLQDRDRYIVEYVKDQWGTDNKVLRIPKEDKRDQYRIGVHSRVMAQALAGYGVVPRKTGICHLPFLKEKALYGPLIRGIFDGDGCAYWHSQTGRVVVRFNGSAFLYGGMSTFLFYHLGIESRPRYTKHSSVLEIYLEDDLRKLSKFLWTMGEDEMFMKRKYEKIAHLLG